MSLAETAELIAVIETRLGEDDIEGRMALALLQLDATRYHQLLREQGLELPRLPRPSVVERGAGPRLQSIPTPKEQ